MTDKRDRELDDELESHLRMAAQDKEDRGASRAPLFLYSRWRWGSVPAPRFSALFTQCYFALCHMRILSRL